jgi:hypothetical protein
MVGVRSRGLDSVRRRQGDNGVAILKVQPGNKLLTFSFANIDLDYLAGAAAMGRAGK